MRGAVRETTALLSDYKHTICLSTAISNQFLIKIIINKKEANLSRFHLEEAGRARHCSNHLPVPATSAHQIHGTLDEMKRHIEEGSVLPTLRHSLVCLLLQATTTPVIWTNNATWNKFMF
jgi:hypothetical protein